MDKLPDYVNCKNKEIVVCPYFMYLDICEETCAYAIDIGGFCAREGIHQIITGLEKEIEDGS